MANEFKVKHGLIVNGSGSTVLDVQGSQGQLFSITDSLSGSLFSVGDISGIPILEVFSDDTVKLGSFGSEAIIVSGSHATVSGSFSGSFEGDGSQLTGILTSTPTLQQVTDQGAITDNNVSITGVLNVSGSYSDPGAMLTLFNSNNSAGASISFNDNLSATQTGLLTYRHSDADSLGGGASFHFTAQPDTVLVVGDSTNGGRFAAYSGNSAAEVDYGFAGDSDTGMYQASSDNLGLVTGGTERIRILSDGKVGVGVTNPDQKLVVQGNIRIDTVGNYLYFHNNNVGVTRDGSSRLVLGGYGGIDFNSSNDSGIANQTLRMRIDAQGQIGIGTAPSADAQVYILHPSSSAGLDVFVSQSSAPTSPQFRVGRGSSQYYGIFTDDGNAHLVHRQDETGGTAHQVLNDIWSSSTGGKFWRWRIADNTGASATSKMILNQDGDLNVLGNITGSNDLLLEGSRIYFTGGSTLIRSLDSYFGVFTTGGSAKSVKAKSIQLSTSYTGTVPDNGILFGTDTTLYRSDTTTLTTNGDLVVEGSVTAQQFHTEFVSSSIIYQSGSTKFGDTVDDNHDFTGSINLSGSINLKDNSFLYLGDSNDLQLYHNGTNSTIANYTGHLYIGNNANDKNIILQSDDGSGGITNYLTIDGVATTVNFSKNAFFGDNIRARFGNNYDLDIFHNGTDSAIQNNTGDLYISNLADDKDIIIRTDDGAGSYEQYMRFDGSATNIKLYKNFKAEDNVKLIAGSGDDIQIFHDGSNNYISSNNSTLYIQNNLDDGDVIFRSDDGSGGLTTYFYLDGSQVQTQFLQNAQFQDGARLKLGSGGDLQQYFDGTNSIISNRNGALVIEQLADDSDIVFKSDDGTGGSTDYLRLDGSTERMLFSKETRFSDNVSLKLGTSGDLELLHDGSISSISNYTGNFHINQHLDDGNMSFRADDGSGGITEYFRLDGGDTNVQFAKNIKINDGADIYLADNGKTHYGDSNDLEIFHDGSNSNITAKGTGHLYISQTTDDKDIIFRSDDGSGGIAEYFKLDGSLGYTTVSKQFLVQDNVKLSVGTSEHGIVMIHDGTDSTLSNAIGDLTIQNFANDKDIVFKSDDGSGGTTEYFRLDGSSNALITSKNNQFIDSVKLWLGSGNDLEIYHNGTNSVINNETNDLQIISNVTDGDISFRADDGTGSPTEYFRLDGGTEKVVFQKNISTNGDLRGSEANSLIEDFITDQSYEGHAFYNPETINAFAGANRWASITLSNAYSTDRTTAVTSLGAEPFMVGGNTFQPYFDNSETEIVIEIDHTSEPLRYHGIVGIQFTHTNWRANRVKIEAYNGSTWTTGIDTTSNDKATVAAKFSLDSAGVQKTKITLGDPDTANAYLRISKIFGYDYKGVSSYDAVKSGTYYLEKFVDNGHYSNIYPAVDSTYSLGTSGLRYSNVYADDTNIADWGSVSASLASINSSISSGDITEVSAGAGLSGGGISGAVTLNLDFSELTDKIDDIAGTTEFIIQDGTTESRKAASEIKLSNFNNDSGWTSNNGDITQVTAGTGLSGGGISGAVTLNLDFSELTDKTTDIAGTTEFIIQDGFTESRKAASEIKLSNFNNDSGWTSNAGTVTEVTVGTGLDVSNGTSTPNITLDLSEFTDMTAAVNSSQDELILLDNGAERRKLISEIDISAFNNDSGYITSFDITEQTDPKYLRSDANDDFSGTLNFTPDTGNILAVDGQTILRRNTSNGSLTFGHDDMVAIAAGDTNGVINSNLNSATELVVLAAEGGFHAYAFPNNDTTWSNREQMTFNGVNGLYVVNLPITGSDVKIDGWGSVSASLAAASVDTNTTYSAGSLLDLSGTTFNVDLSELTDMTETMVAGDEFVVLDGSAQKRKAASEINLSIFNNDSGFTSNTGTVTEVTVGTGLDVSNGTSTPNITLDLSEFTDMTANVDGSQDELILLDNGAERRKLISEINLGQFNNDQGWTNNTGTVDTSGTPADNQIAVFTDSNTIEGTSGLTYNGSDLGVTGDINITKVGGVELTLAATSAGSTTIGLNPNTSGFGQIWTTDTSNLRLGTNATTAIEVDGSSQEVSITGNINTTGYVTGSFYNDRVSLGTNVDFSAGQVFTKTLSGNTTLTFSNYKVGMVKDLRIIGDHSLTFPAGCNVIGGGTYDGSAANFIQVICIDQSAPEFWVSISRV